MILPEMIDNFQQNQQELRLGNKIVLKLRLEKQKTKKFECAKNVFGNLFEYMWIPKYFR